MLVVVLILYIMTYFVRIEGLYLASTDATSLASFARDDIFHGISDGMAGQKTNLAATLFRTGPVAFPAVTTGLAVLIVFFFSLFVTVGSVCDAASVAKSSVANMSNEQCLDAWGLTKDQASKLANEMDIWPVGYVRYDLLLLGVFFAIFTLVFYRIGLYVTGLIIGMVVITAFRRITRTFGRGKN